jgi:hypothetical protein
MWISVDSKNFHVDYLKTLLAEPSACFRLRFWAGFFRFLVIRSGLRAMSCFLRDFKIISDLQVCLSEGPRRSVVG